MGIDKDEKNEKPKIKTFFKNFKKIKGVEIAVVVVLIAVMLLIAFGNFNKTKSTTEKETAISIDTADAYITGLETKLSKVLGEIEGAGNVSTLITIEGGYKLTIATTSEEVITKGSAGGTTTENKTVKETVIYVIDKNGQETPLVLYQENPVIIGVIIVASGADNVNVKMNIIKAVQIALNIKVSCIEVFAGK